MNYYAQTMPGVEEIAWLEIRQRLAGARFGEFLFAKEQNGLVLFGYDGPAQDLLQLRTVEDVFVEALSLLGVSRDWGDLRQTANSIASSDDFGEASRVALRFHRKAPPVTYRVIARQYGRFEYRRKDLADAVAKGVEQRFGGRWRLVEDNADVEVWANLLGSRLMIGLRLSDRSMRHRERRVELPAALRPSVAAAMVFLTEPAVDDCFVDPMCGSGTILLERAAAGAYRRLLGGDLDEERAEATRLNVAGGGSVRRAATAGRAAAATICQWDAGALPLAGGSVDKLASNLPFGKQIGRPAELKRLYSRFMAELNRVLRRDGRAVLLTSEYDLLKDVVREQPALEILRGYSVAVLGQWGRIYILRRG